MKTQSSSKARVKNDLIGDELLKKIFVAYETEDLQEFQKTCVSAIMMSAGKASTKATFVDTINKAKSKAVILTSMTNYTLAGQGLKV
jgi:hypothetical protein